MKVKKINQDEVDVIVKQEVSSRDEVIHTTHARSH